MQTEIAGLSLKNPVMTAAGTCRFGAELSSFFDLNLLGAFTTSTVTSMPRNGYPLPRIAECRRIGVVSAVGAENPGVDVVVEQMLPGLVNVFSGPVIVNVSGRTSDDFVAVARVLNEQPAVSALELNLVVPDVKVVRAVRAVTKKPVFVKLSATVTNLSELAKACEYEGADAMTLIGSLPAMRIDIYKRRPMLGHGAGFLSGPALFPVAVRAIYDVSHAVRIPVIGCGGVSRAENVVEMLMAGAKAVQVGTASMRNPLVCRDIILRLPDLMQELQVESVTDLIGMV